MYCINYSCELSRIGKFIETESRLVVAKDQGEEDGKKLLNGYKVLFCSEKQRLYNIVNVCYATELFILKLFDFIQISPK